ncbi:hypothetical protein IVB34_33210 [Bradyrhizobium sp. 2]|uniref:hypothetical protein n=1 Tax=Bradyrhizobium sp. 2 TaxID=190045 RepID=UPI001FF8BFE1|nr:hypothetical protein [Bradyrhizobium sp. 2]MCK1463089.1 hypothetical protein [Bradyrhizobium sp. 2]
MTEQTNHQTTEGAYRPLKLDREAFRGFLEGMDLTSAQEDALLDSVWLIIVGIIDLDPSQKSSACDSKPLAVDSSSVLAFLSTSKITNAEDAEAAAGPSAPRMDS